MARHKHYDLIVAWAEGKQIQSAAIGYYDWKDASAPLWDHLGFQFRIKPEPKYCVGFTQPYAWSVGPGTLEEAQFWLKKPSGKLYKEVE